MKESKELINKFFSLNIDTSKIGLIRHSNNSPYFCTPKEAYIIGYLGVDGIHYCTIPLLRSPMVFAVDPMLNGDNHVEPIARNFKDFLSLLLACRDASILAQVAYCTESQLKQLSDLDKDYLKSTAPIFQTIEEKFQIKACPNPYEYVQNLQKNFDYTMIPYTDEFYDTTDIPRPNTAK